MNLIDPPEVKDLSPRRVDDLHTALVDQATADVRPKPRRTWIPVLAATAGVATIATAVVVVPRLGGDTRAPDGSATVAGSPSASGKPSPSSTSSAPARTYPGRLPGAALKRVSPPVKVPAPALTVDRGPVSEADARAMLKRCVETGAVGFTSADVATVELTLARWVALPPDDASRELPGATDRQLVVMAVRADGKYDANCVERNGIVYESTGGVNQTGPLAAVEVMSGGGMTHDGADKGRWTVRGATPFEVAAGVARVDPRLVWNGGSTPWQTAAFADGAGFADISATGVGAKRSGTKTEIRLVDADGYLLRHAFSGVGSINVMR